MALKFERGTTIWPFLTSLQDHVINPTLTEILQLDNNKQPRRGKSKATLLNQKVIKIAEDKLSSGIITPIEFLEQMSHHFSVVDLTPEERVALEDQMADDEALIAELSLEEEEYEDEDEGALQHISGPHTMSGNSLDCRICLANQAQWAFVPCGHRCACTHCKNILEQSPPLSCPICRTPAVMVIQVFDA
jgi:hypothetical protein